MKKNYIIPCIEVTECHVQANLLGGPSQFTFSDDEVDDGMVKEESSATQDNFWEDEW